MTRRLPHLRALQRDEFREMASMVTITRPDGTVVAGTSPGDVTFDSEEVYDGRASVRRSDTATRTHTAATDSVTVAARPSSGATSSRWTPAPTPRSSG